MSDITAHKKAEAAAEKKLKTEIDRYELVIGILSEGVYDWQPIDDKLLVSDRLKSLFDFHEDKFESRHWLERIHPDDCAGYRAAMRVYFKGKSDHFGHEYRIRIGDGQYRWVHDQATGLRGKDGRVYRLVGTITDVTEIKQREQELAEADQQKSVLLTELNAVLDAIDFGVMFMGPDLRGKIINRAFRDIWRVPDEFVETHPTIADVINYNRYNHIYDVPESEFDAYVAARVKEIHKGDSIPRERTDLADGRIIRYQIITLPNGGRMLTYFDITELKQRERKAREAEAAIADAHARINHILASSDAVLYSIEASGDYAPTFVSDNLLELFGYEPREYLEDRKFVQDRIHPEDTPGLEGGFSHLFEKGHLVNEYRFRHKDGGYRWLSDELRVIYDEAGKPAEIVGYWSDIGERKEAEAALSKQTSYIQLLEKIAVAANEASVIEDALQICLDEVCSLTGWPVGHVLYMPTGDGSGELITAKLWHLDKPEEFKTFKKVTEETRFAPGIGLPGRVLNSGKPAWIIDVTKDPNYPRAKLAENIGVKAAFCFPVLVGSKVAAVLEFYTPEAVAPDEQLLEVMAQVGTQLGRVIERRQAEEALAIAKEKAEAAKEQAESANRAKTQFVAKISHEFRTPLNAVIGITEMLIEDARDEDHKAWEEPLTRVHRAGQHLLSLINEFLDISKIEAGKIDLHIKPFNISELIKDITATVKPMLDSNNNTFEVKYLTGQEAMRSDGKRVMQILLNLLSNAAKFTENGKVILKTKSSNESDTDYILFDVIDTGTGIPEDKIENVFDEYSQMKSSGSSKYASTGLGLGISRKLARIMGGDITVTSERGAGSTFTAKLPVELKGDAVQSHKLT